ncbi:MAG TPA: hypothetical protein VEL74_24800 [Thermoanaerobaculia bacterium]|nr:hypothetical protein [Thermoanaerobaculia bacterium]
MSGLQDLRKNWLEWTVFAVGLVAVLGTFGYLAYEALAGEVSPPRVIVELGRPTPDGSRWTVPVRVRNDGGETAEEVQVEVSLESPGHEPETAKLEVAFVPRKSQREGWVTFSRDPAAGRLTGRAIGYEKP